MLENILCEEDLLKLNRMMLSLGEPDRKDFEGYNKPDYSFCQQYLFALDSDDTYNLLKRLQKYKNRQLIDYKDVLESSFEKAETAYNKKQKINSTRANGSFDNSMKVSVSFEPNNICVVYLRNKPKHFYLEPIAGSHLYKVNSCDLVSLLKLLTMQNYFIPSRIWEEVRKRNLVSSRTPKVKYIDFYSAKREYLNAKKEETNNRIIENVNKRFIKDGIWQLSIDDVTSSEEELVLNYPLVRWDTGNVIYCILKSLQSRRYYTDEYGRGNYAVRKVSYFELIDKFDSYSKHRLDTEPIIDYSQIKNHVGSIDTRIKIALSDEADDSVSISFPYSLQIVDAIKKISYSNRKWDGANKRWLIKTNALFDLKEKLKTLDNLNLDDFDKYSKYLVDTSNTFRITYYSGDGVNAMYLIMYDSKNTVLANIIESYNQSKYVLPAQIYITDLKALCEDIENSALDVDCTDMKTIITNYDSRFENTVFEPYPISGLKRSPFKHQEEALEYMLKTKRFILGDEMGLGKTYESILWGLSIPYKRLVICPAVLKLNWKKEIKAIDEKQKVYVVSSKTKDIPPDNDFDWLIINYEMLNKFMDKLSYIDFKVLICDEAHYIKSVASRGNATSTRAKNVLALCKKIPFRAMLTGTPITNKTKDLWNLLVAIEHPLSRDFYTFAKKYCNGVQTRFGFSFDGSAYQNELYCKLQSGMIRRLKSDVLDLPDKMRSFVPNEIKLSAYNKRLKEYLSSKDTLKTEGAHLVHLNALRYILAQEKVKTTINLAENILEENNSVVIFSNYTNPIKEILEYFGDDAVSVTGETPKDKVSDIVDKFQNGKAKVFVANINSAGVGITLTSSSNVIFNDYNWVPANHLQAEERIHRIGQDKVCNIYYNYAVNAEIDNLLSSVIESKLRNIKLILDNENVSFVDEAKSTENNSVFKELMSKLKDKEKLEKEK